MCCWCVGVAGDAGFVVGVVCVVGVVGGGVVVGVDSVVGVTMVEQAICSIYNIIVGRGDRPLRVSSR